MSTFFTTYGQRLIPIGDNFLHGEKYITKDQAKGIIKDHPDAYEYYSKSQNQFASAKVFGVTSIVTLSSGLLMSIAAAPAALISESAASTVGFGLILMLSGCVSGTVGLIKKKRAKRNLELSLIIYNQQYKEYGNSDYDIDLSINGNGVGLTYSF